MKGLVRWIVPVRDTQMDGESDPELCMLDGCIHGKCCSLASGTNMFFNCITALNLNNLHYCFSTGTAGFCRKLGLTTLQMSEVVGSMSWLSLDVLVRCHGIALMELICHFKSFQSHRQTGSHKQLMQNCQFSVRGAEENAHFYCGGRLFIDSLANSKDLLAGSLLYLIVYVSNQHGVVLLCWNIYEGVENFIGKVWPEVFTWYIVTLSGCQVTCCLLTDSWRIINSASEPCLC